MKTYARQIAPEYQESPLVYEGYPKNIAIFGNSDFMEYYPDFLRNVYDVLNYGELEEMVEDSKSLKPWYKNITEAINNILPPQKAKYSKHDIGLLKKLILEYSDDEEEIFCKVLSVVTGEKWDYKEIRGCCQDDWNCIYYPVEKWSDEAIEAFETEYFNMGTEWIINDEYSIYCTAQDMEGIKKEIAEAEGGSPEDIVLYYFDGWSRTPEYEEA